MTWKQSIDWFLESSWAWSFFTWAFAQPTKSPTRLYPFDKPIKSLHFHSFVVSVLFACFHFEVNYENRSISLSTLIFTLCLSFPVPLPCWHQRGKCVTDACWRDVKEEDSETFSFHPSHHPFCWVASYSPQWQFLCHIQMIRDWDKLVVDHDLLVIRMA